MSNHHTHSIEDYQFNHGFHRVMSSGKYVALHPHYLGRPLTHEEMDFNLLYAEQTLAGFRIFGSNSDLSLSDDDLGKSLVFHKIASNDADFARYTAAGYTEGQYIWIPDCCGGTPIDCSTFQVSSITATDCEGYSCGDFVVDSITATDCDGVDDCISFVVDSIVATDSEGSTLDPRETATPTPTATPTATPTLPVVTPTPTVTEVTPTSSSIGNLWVSNNARNEHYEYSIPANNASSFILTNQINIDAYDSHVSSSNNVIGFASSINNSILIYRRSGNQWNYETSVPCFVNDDNTLSISTNKNHFDFSDDGNTLVCISNVGAGDDITEYGGGSQTEGRIYKYQPSSGAWTLSGVIPRLSNHTGMRYASISADGNTVTFSEFAAQNDPGLSIDFPRRRTGIWNWSGTNWVPKMNPAGYEQGYRTYLNSDGSKMLTTTFDPSNHLSDTPTGVKIMYWDSSAGVIGAWVDEFVIPNTSNILVPRMFSPSGNEFVIGDGNTEYVYAWDGSTWNLKGTITTGAIAGQYSYESDNNANILTVQEWTTYLQDGTIGVWEYDGNNYVQLTPELTHSGFSHSSAIAATSVPVVTPTPTPTPTTTATPTPTATLEATPTPTPTPEEFHRRTILELYRLTDLSTCDYDESTVYYAYPPYDYSYFNTLGTGKKVVATDGMCYHILRKYGPNFEFETAPTINLTLVEAGAFSDCTSCPPIPTPTPTPTPNATELSHLVYATEFNLNGEWWSTESYGPGVDPAITGQRREVYVNQIYSDYYDNTDGSAVALTFGNELTQFNQPDNYAGWLHNSFVGWPQSRWPERKAFKIQNISDLAYNKLNNDSNITDFPLTITKQTGLAYEGEGIGQLEINMPLYASDGSGYGNLPSTGAILVSQTEGGKYSSDPGQTYELPQGNFEDEVNSMQNTGTSLRYVIYENWIVKRVMNVAPGLPYGAAPDPTPTPTPTPTATPTPTPTATPTATPTPTATLPPAPPAQFNWVVSTDVDSTNRVNYIEENLENDPYGVWASNEELQLRHYQYPGISFNYFPVEAGQSYYIKLEENNNPNGRFTISSVTGKNATNSVYLFNNDPAVIYTIDSVWNKATDSTRPDVAFLNNNNQAVDNQCAYDNEGLVKIYNKVDTNNGTDSTLCDANGYLNSANYIKIDVPANASPGEEFTIGWGGLQYWPHWAQGQNRITDTEWVDVRQITPAQDRGSIQFRVVENPTQPTVTPTPLPADNKLPISLIRSIGTLGNVADSTYSDTQAFLISKNYASPGSLTGVNERTSGNPYDPQTGDILYDDVSWSDELNPLPNATFVFVKSVPLGTNEWFWITTDSNGIMTVTQL